MQTSMIVGLLSLTTKGFDQKQAAGMQISMIVGLLYLAIGVFRLGFLANFLSHSVISGFTTGAALLIGLSQLKFFFGISIAKTHTGLETAIEIVKELGNAKWREVVMSTVWLAMLLAIKKVSKKYPKVGWLRPLGPITVVIIAILVVVIGGLDDGETIRIVGNVPKGARRWKRTRFCVLASSYVSLMLLSAPHGPKVAPLTHPVCVLP